MKVNIHRVLFIQKKEKEKKEGYIIEFINRLGYRRWNIKGINGGPSFVWLLL